MKRHYIYILLILISVIAFHACDRSEWDIEPGSQGAVGTNPGNRTETDDTRKVLLLYSAGYNNLQSWLKEDIEDLMKGWLPGESRNDNVLLIYSHLSRSSSDLNTPTAPVLFRVYSDYGGNTVADTLVRYETSDISASAEQLNTVLTYIKNNFPASSYGMIFSSHATGYLPAGYYNKPNDYVFSEDISYRQGKRMGQAPTYVPYTEPAYDPDRPMVKSIGQTAHAGRSYEMDLRDFAEAIPMKLDYLLFDACLMGGIEVAYELAGKCNLIAFSQAEVLAEGLNYSTITSHLIKEKEMTDMVSVCDDYFQQYDQKTGAYRSATISLVDCNRLEHLAELCRGMFGKYRQNIAKINPDKVQRFYTGSHHWFYDLESILSAAGITEEEMESLHDALEECVNYKAHTPSFLGEFNINTFSGFSMYLPKRGSAQLDRYYRTLKWNEATGLVQ